MSEPVALALLLASAGLLALGYAHWKMHKLIRRAEQDAALPAAEGAIPRGTPSPMVLDDDDDAVAEGEPGG